MIQHIDRNRRVEQRTYDHSAVGQAIISQVGDRKFLAYRLVHAEGYTRKATAAMMGCDRKTIRAWLAEVEPVVARIRDEFLAD